MQTQPAPLPCLIHAGKRSAHQRAPARPIRQRPYMCAQPCYTGERKRLQPCPPRRHARAQLNSKAQQTLRAARTQLPQPPLAVRAVSPLLREHNV